MRNNYRLPIGLKKVGVVSAIYELRMHQNLSDTRFVYNWDNEGFSDHLNKSEIDFLESISAQIEEKSSKVFSVDLVHLGPIKTVMPKQFLFPEDIHIFIPSGYLNLDIEQPEVAKFLCDKLNVDILMSIRFVFTKYQFAELFDGPFNRVRVQMKVKLVNSEGKVVGAQELWGESHSFLREDTFVNGLIGAKVSTDLRNYFTLQSDYAPLFREAFLDLLSKIPVEKKAA